MHRTLLKREDVVITEIVDLGVQEVSIVDRPAIGRPWDIVKNEVTEQPDGSLVIDETVTSPVRAAALSEAMWSGFSAMETHLAVDDNPLTKALQVNETARADVWSAWDHIGESMYQIANLLGTVDGTPFQGSLDHAIGSEMVRIAHKFVMLARGFGVDGFNALGDIMDEHQMDVSKAKRITPNRKKRLGEAVELLTALFADIDDDVLDTDDTDAVDKADASVDSQSNRMDSLESHIDSSLGKVVAYINECHTATSAQISKLAPVQKSAPSSQQVIDIPVIEREAVIVKSAVPTASTLPFGADPVDQ